MNKEVLSVAVAATLLFGMGSAYAGNEHEDKVSKLDRKCQENPNNRRCGADPRAVPEIDATSGAPALALVLGVALLGAERLRRRSQQAS